MLAFIQKHKRITLLFFLAVIGLVISQVRHLELSYDFEAFFPEGSEDLEHYQDRKKDFGGDADFLLLGWEAPLNSEETLHFIQQLEGQLEGLEYVKKVITPFDLKVAGKTPLGLTPFPILNRNNQEDWATKIQRYPEHFSSFTDSSGTRTALRIEVASNLSKEKSDEALSAIQQVLKGYPQDFYLAGRIHGQKVILDQMKDNLIVFSILSMVLVLFFLWFFFRQFWIIIGPLILLILVLGTTAGLLGILGLELNILGTIIPTILFVVTTSDAIHLLERYLHEYQGGKSKMESLKIGFREIGMATFLTSLTTCIGFAALISIPIGPIQQFGIQVSIGVGVAYVLTFTLFITLLLLFPPPQKSTYGNPKFWPKYLRKNLSLIFRHPKKLWAFFGGLLLLFGIGSYRVEINNQLMQDWDTSSEEFQNYTFFETHFGGIRPAEFSLTSSISDPLHNDQFWTELLQIETFLVDRYGVNDLIAPGRILSLSMASSATARSKSEERFLRRLLTTQQLYELAKGLFRIYGRGPDLGGNWYEVKNKELEEFCKTQQFETLRIQPTGLPHLVDVNNRRLSAGLIKGLTFAVGIVFLILLLVFKSWRPALASLLPNLFPIIGVLAFMGFAGIELKVSTAIVMTIVFGLAVDDTIHYMNGFLLWRRKLNGTTRSIVATQFSTGKAIIVTSIVLIGGFALLAFSGFKSTFYLGILVSIGLVLAVIADTLLLPLCLLTFLGKNQKRP